MIKVAFANDCDLMTWSDYHYIHGMFDKLNLHAKDSFWLFSPDNSDMALFTDSFSQKTSNHDNLLQQLKEGNIDTLHGIGSFGRTPTYPSKEDIKRALGYLSDNGVNIKIWSNHGNTNHTHNIVAQGSRSYHQGDLPYSNFFILDVIQEYGIEYFWLSHRLRHSLKVPYRTIVPERTPSGKVIKTFTRFAPSWKTNAWTMHEMITRGSLQDAINNDQNVIYFTHWGTRGKEEDMTKPLLRRESLAALALLSEMQRSGDLEVVSLSRLLQEEDRKSLEQEIERCGVYHLDNTHKSLDNYYRVHFKEDKIKFFSSLVNLLGLKGDLLLDAGGGTGNLCFPASQNFSTVVCMDKNPQALEAAQSVTNSLQLNNIHFKVGNLEETNFGAGTFDAICARGVIHLADHDKVLSQFHKISRKNATVMITVNGDGFYQHAICEKKMNVKKYSRLLWNTFLRRAGGDDALSKIFTQTSSPHSILGSDEATLLDEIMDIIPTRMEDVIRNYCPELKALVGNHGLKYMLFLANQQGLSLSADQIAIARKVSPPEKNKWECHYPEEFLEIAQKVGYSNSLWQPQSFFSPDSNDNNEDYHQGLLKIWFALLIK